MKKIILCLIGCFFNFTYVFCQNSIDFVVNIDGDRKPISEFIYGTNSYTSTSNDPLNPTVTRFGGNRTTTYNWETNYSNAGSDYIFHSDLWWLGAAGIDQGIWGEVPGSVIQAKMDTAIKSDRVFMLTLQAAGYVAADDNGTVSCNAPCDRWVPVYANKPDGNYEYPPDLNDNAVYIDEELSWLINKYGIANDGGIKYYEIDNEPELWDHTHEYIWPEKVTPEELASINNTYARMVRRMDPSAKILGYVGFGWWGLVSVDLRTYLQEMKVYSDDFGSPLIDLFDWHFYPNDLKSFTGNENWDLLQAPRVLWDDSYYIPGGSGPMGYYGQAPQLIHRYNNIINEEFSGLEMALTEWNSSSDAESVFSGLYAVDLLGVLGQEEVEVATYFDRPKGYEATAFKLFRNYDGNNSTYGDMYVQATTSDLPNATIYAATESQSNDNRLHIIVVAKDMSNAISGNFTINGAKQYDKAEVYYFDATTQDIKQVNDIQGITNNTFSYNIPQHSAVHLILSSSSECSIPNLGEDRSLCDVGADTLYSGIESEGYVYTWYKNNVQVESSSANSLTINQGGIYRLVADSSGCISQDQVTILDKIPPVDLGADITLCDATSDTLSSNVTGDIYEFSWTKDGQQLSDSSSLIVTESGTYTLTVSTNSCGNKSDSVEVVSLFPEVLNDTICAAGVATLEVSGQGTYQWYGSQTADDSLFSGNIYKPTITESSTFYVEDISQIVATLGRTELTGSTWSIGATDIDNPDKKILFEVYNAITLKSVSVYPVNPETNVTIRLRDVNDANTLHEITVNEVGTGKQIIPLDFKLSPGTYLLDAVGTSGALLFESENGTFPYTNGDVELRANVGWAATWGGLFFDWKFTKGNKCIRMPAYAIINDSEDCEVTSTDISLESKSLKIFPNPFLQTFEVNLEGEFAVQIYSLEGKLYHNEQCIE